MRRSLDRRLRKRRQRLRAPRPYPHGRGRPHVIVRGDERPALSWRAGWRERAGGDLGIPPAAMSRRPHHAGLALATLLVVACCGRAFAYRPFDGTDAAVAEPGVVEIELGPAQ